MAMPFGIATTPQYFPDDCFYLSGFLQTLVPMFLGVHFVGGRGDLSFGSLGCGP